MKTFLSAAYHGQHKGTTLSVLCTKYH